ncbi:hypothetical protein B0H11DRAFT_1932092 [Mycena galericulata]|nr:hypothetical protein B0H11DRAFT_1932092 [Mycena galericulata]
MWPGMCLLFSNASAYSGFDRLVDITAALPNMPVLHIDLFVRNMHSQRSLLHFIPPNLLRCRTSTSLFISGQSHNVTYDQDFTTDVTKAVNFFGQHSNSTSFCYYNPKDETQVLFDVDFTTWKWAIASVFGASFGIP